MPRKGPPHRQHDPDATANHPDWDAKLGTPRNKVAKRVVEEAHGRYSASAQSAGPAENVSTIRSAGVHGPAQAPGFPSEQTIAEAAGATTDNPKLYPPPGSGDDPMTATQASDLTKLCQEAKIEAPTGPLTKTEASRLIDALEARLSH